MKMTWRKILWIVIGVVLGEFALAILTTVAQEVVFSGIGYTESPPLELLGGGLLTIVAAVLAGIVARIAGRKFHVAIPIVISLLIAVETTYLIVTGWAIDPDPLWFEILAGTSLIIGIWPGYHYQCWVPYFTRKSTQPRAG